MPATLSLYNVVEDAQTIAHVRFSFGKPGIIIIELYKMWNRILE